MTLSISYAELVETPVLPVTYANPYRLPPIIVIWSAVDHKHLAFGERDAASNSIVIVECLS
jgi:hypothetical protein